MENVKFIDRITMYLETSPGQRRVKVGNCIYITLQSGLNVKLYCVSNAVIAEVISKVNGKVDGIELPFANYFEPTQCSPGARKWTQYIENGRWYFSDQYPHVLPTDEDYDNLAHGIHEFISLYEAEMPLTRREFD